MNELDQSRIPYSIQFSEVRIGLSKLFVTEITPEIVDSFAILSGDTNPLHTDDDYAKRYGHPSRVAHGLLTSSFYSKLVGMYLPGKFALLHQIDIRFTSPVYVGDIVTISGSIIAIHDSVRQLEISAAIKNQNEKKISKANIKVGMYE